jgi:hypothetical protein
MERSEFESTKVLLARVIPLAKCEFARGTWIRFSRIGKKIGGRHLDWRKLCFARTI